jgi:hypothetical protein
MRALLILLALAVVGLGFTTWTLATSPAEHDRPSLPPDELSVAVPCELLPEGEPVWLLADPHGAHMLEPAMSGTGARAASIEGEARKAWVFVVFADEKPKVRVE